MTYLQLSSDPLHPESSTRKHYGQGFGIKSVENVRDKAERIIHLRIQEINGTRTQVLLVLARIKYYLLWIYSVEFFKSFYHSQSRRLEEDQTVGVSNVSDKPLRVVTLVHPDCALMG